MNKAIANSLQYQKSQRRPQKNNFRGSEFATASLAHVRPIGPSENLNVIKLVTEMAKPRTLEMRVGSISRTYFAFLIEGE
jgi:hypothetical protein